MAHTSSILLLVLVSTLSIVQVHSSVDYYWRDFDGTIPDDAVPAGLDLNNQSLYVGQGLGTLFDIWAISPIGLSPGQMGYYTPINTAFEPGYANITNALKVLCSTNKDKFQWTSTTDKDFPSVKNVIQGGWGYEIGSTVVPLYVGRSLRFGYSAVGRIQTEFDYFQNCVRYMHDGTQYYATEYDVLTYQD